MSGNKVKFHPLERLDIIDINALQDSIYEQLELVLGGSTGSASTTRAGGLLRINGVTYNPVNSTIRPGDFIFVASTPSATITNVRTMRVGFYDTELGGASVASFLNAKNAVQSYYNNSNQLPPAPGSAGYSAAEYGQYYPKVYARTFRTDSVPDTRRFWNVANNTEESSTVNTRQAQQVSFLTLTDGSSPPALAGDTSQWVEIFQIRGWQVAANIVQQPNAVIFNYLLDNFIQQDSGNVYNKLALYTDNLGILNSKGGGLGAGLSILHSYLVRDRTQGSSDLAVPAAFEVDTVGTQNLPKYSLDGLAGLLDAQRAAQHHADLTLNFTSQIALVGGVYTNLFSHNTQQVTSTGTIVTALSSDRMITPLPAPLGANRVPVQVYRDMGLYESLGFALTGDVTTVEAPATRQKLTSFVAQFFVRVPDSYAGWGISINNLSGIRIGTSTGIVEPHLFSLSGESASQHLRVQELDVKLANGSTVEGIYGFRIAMPTFKPLFTSGTGAINSMDSSTLVNLNEFTHQYSLRLSFTLSNPEAV